MGGWSAKAMTAGLVIVGTLSVPAIGSAQYRYGGGNRQSVALQCGPGQRAVLSQRGGSRTVARCVGSSRRFAGDGYGRRVQTRGYDSYRYNNYRPAGTRYYERRPRRSAAKSALMIAGGAATGAGVGGALRGKKGALIGAAIGGGASTIYETQKR